MKRYSKAIKSSVAVPGSGQSFQAICGALAKNFVPLIADDAIEIQTYLEGIEIVDSSLVNVRLENDPNYEYGTLYTVIVKITTDAESTKAGKPVIYYYDYTVMFDAADVFSDKIDYVISNVLDYAEIVWNGAKNIATRIVEAVGQ